PSCLVVLVQMQRFNRREATAPVGYTCKPASELRPCPSCLSCVHYIFGRASVKGDCTELLRWLFPLEKSHCQQAANQQPAAQDGKIGAQAIGRGGAHHDLADIQQTASRRRGR